MRGIKVNIELLMKLEKQFKCNENFGDTGLSTFEFQKGDLPIIITAPHSVKTRKVTKDGMDVIKENEGFTGAFALYLNQSFGVHAMVRNNYPYNTFIDPKKEIRDLIEYIRKNNIKYLVDIHGAHRKRSFDIAPGTSHGRFIEHDERYKNIIISFLAAHIKA